jgi:hypothetical protein
VKYKMKLLATKASRTITAAEVRRWVGDSAKSKLGEAQFREIAVGLTKFRWPGDPPPPPDSPWLTKEPKVDPDRWWDFQAATDAVKLLLYSVPRMLSHWERQRWARETRGGYDAIKTLGDALSVAAPYIEWPFGHYERQTRPKRPKPWHIMALSIARLVLRVMVEAGQKEPGITRNSVVVRLVRNVLIRMNFPNAKMVTPTAIGAHLTRWDKTFGLIPKGIAALTT